MNRISNTFQLNRKWIRRFAFLITLHATLFGTRENAMSSNLQINGNGISWLDTTDDWGRPWGDAASSFYRRLETHREFVAAQGVPSDKMEFAVGTEITLQKVFRPKIWFKGDFSGRVSITAAKGESEGFQLVVCPIADAERGIRYLSDEKSHGNGSLREKTVHIGAVETTALIHEKNGFEIPRKRIELHLVGYIPTLPVQYPVMHVGEWPDPLMPLSAFEVANPNCQPLWVDVHVPRDAPAGNYSGALAVRGPHDVRIDVSLAVHDFALPETPASFTMGWSLHDWFTGDGVDLCIKKLAPLLDHRVAPWHVADQFHDNLDDFDRIAEHLWHHGVKLQVLNGLPKPEVYEHVKAKGWLDRFMCIWGDEPHQRDYDEYRIRSEEIRKNCPGLAVAMTEDPRPDNVGLFDLWIPEPNSQNDEWIQDALRRSDRVWWYLCQLPIHAEYPGPIHASPGMIVDRPAIDHRIIYWLAFKQNIEGVAYWAISSWPGGWESWPEKPWPVNPLSKFPYSGQHNGNGFICYPGNDGNTWPSIRLKCIRDGLEDHDYLTILKTRSGSNPSTAARRLLDLPPEVAMGLRYYNQDPQALLQTRNLVAEQIVASEQ
jgi:hypothetical protein